jgi:hypothetical protein
VFELEEILTVCKILGTASVIITGIFGILFETHYEVISAGREKIKKLNRVGWLFLTLTIVGGGVAVIASIVEYAKERESVREEHAKDQVVLTSLDTQLKETKKVLHSLAVQSDQTGSILQDLATQQKLLDDQSDQVKIVLGRLSVQASQSADILQGLSDQQVFARKSLDAVDRTLTRINWINVKELVFELPVTNALVSQLCDKLDTFLLKSNKKAAQDSGVSQWGGGLLSLSMYDDLIIFPTDNKNWNPYAFGAGKEKEMRELTDVLCNFSISLGICRDQTNISDQYGPEILDQFDLKTDFLRSTTEIRYYNSSRERKKLLIVKKNAFSPRLSWQSNGRVVSLKDLEDAHIFFVLWSYPRTRQIGEAFSQLKARWASLSFDDSPAMLVDLKTAKNWGGDPLPIARIPDLNSPQAETPSRDQLP